MNPIRNTFTIVPDGPFSLSAAANFGFGPQMARPKPHAGVHLRQDSAGNVHGEVLGGADPARVKAQVARVLSLDRPGSAWVQIGKGDRIIAALQKDFPGLRPVLFYSPYEAAAWSVLSQRRHRAQAALLRKRLSAAHGAVFALPDGPLEAFPLPQALLRVKAFEGIEPERMERLHSIARAALDGRLDPGRLLAMKPEAAGLILLRSTGATDILTLHEPHMPEYMAHFYHLEKRAGIEDEILRICVLQKPGGHLEPGHGPYPCRR
ncbi:MAG: hypothetical protein GIX03_03735 [Candidatus Eremiobacteraeota bacterium]|nr:hypothetical protein [Candidatus Eremiobacteraeota bacterium]MBC5802124.1 hypothetical protein [Candidatus Eremiobacteraeota bacterium]MBC5822461.1 hypothetical protein [Candidatus Eremiobacteraeota bacterium]